MENISDESWREDLQFAIGLSAREDQLEIEAHMMQYLEARYWPLEARVARHTVRAALNWMVRNWKELKTSGIVGCEDGVSWFPDALATVLYERLFSINPEVDWETFDLTPLQDVASELNRRTGGEFG